MSGPPEPLNEHSGRPLDDKMTWGEPLSKPEDQVTLRSVLDCIVVISTCPQAMIPINGTACTPTEVHYHLPS